MTEMKVNLIGNRKLLKEMPPLVLQAEAPENYDCHVTVVRASKKLTQSVRQSYGSHGIYSHFIQQVKNMPYRRANDDVH